MRSRSRATAPSGWSWWSAPAAARCSSGSRCDGARVKARDNPFAADRVLRVRYRPQGWTWEQLLARLEQLDYRGAIVGPEGRGKTTLLEDLGERLKGRGHNVRHLGLTRERPRFEPG